MDIPLHIQFLFFTHLQETWPLRFCGVYVEKATFYKKWNYALDIFGALNE